MDLTPNEYLIKAGILIREGRTKSARAILLDLLREDKENAQAWFMLSYTIPDLEKQIYAVQQALVYRPNNPKAQKRLGDLTGALPPSSPEPVEAEIIAPQEPEYEEYSQPVFPSKPSEETQEDETELQEGEVEADPLDALRSSVDDYRQFQSEDPEPSFTPRVDEIRKDIQEEEKKSRVFGMRRSQFFLGAAVLVVIFIIIAIIISNIRQELARTRILTDAPATLTAAPTSEPAATEPIAQPTSLPEPTILPTPFNQPAEITSAFAWNTLAQPNGITQENMNLVTSQLLSLVGAEISPEFRTYSVSDMEFQGLVHSFPKLPEFEDQVSTTKMFYQTIGLASAEDDFSTLFANFWADPNGTLAILPEDTVAVFGYEFNDFQKYSYAQGVMQLVRHDQFPDAPIYSVNFPCYLPTEKCDIWNAVIKGEAAFSALQWAKENLDTDTVQNLEESNIKYTFTPISPTPTDLMDTLIKSPYQVGRNFAEAVFNSQGWDGLAALYTNPPKSTEQILHPEKYLAGENPTGIIAADLGDILGEGWTPLFKGPIGEWKTFLMLAHNPNPLLRLEIETAELAAAGWNGDHTQIFTSPEGKNIILFHWAWDTSGEQAQFEGIIREHASRMVGGLEALYNEITCEVSTFQTSCILSSAEETIWLLVPDLETGALILDNYSFSGQ